MKKYIFYILGIFLAAFILNSYGFTQVNGASMNPTLKDGDFLIVDFNKEPEDGDIVIIDTSNIENWDNSATQIVKRYYAEYSTDGLYVLGDNADRSYDSRHVGEINKDCLVGVVIFSFH